MAPELQDYLEKHSFVETTSTRLAQTSVVAREYLNGQFRIRIVNERRNETYIQVGTLAEPYKYYFLNGVVAFLTNDDTATRVSEHQAERLNKYHEDITKLCASSPDGETRRESFALWLSEFAAREQARLTKEATNARDTRKPWWKLW